MKKYNMKKLLMIFLTLLSMISCSDEPGSAIGMDGLKPEFRITSPGEAGTVKKSITLEFESNWPIQIDSIKINLNSANNSFIRNNNSGYYISSNDFDPGQNILYVQLKDAYGNTSEIKTRTFYYVP